MKIFRLLTSCLLAALILCPPSAFAGLNLEKLPEEDIQKVQRIIQKLEPMIKAREAEETLATLTFGELYQPLSRRERRFLKQFQKIDPLKAGIKTKWRGMAYGNEDLVKLEKQPQRKNGQETYLPTQYVPRHVLPYYEQMMEAMQKDLGKRLYVESGYRSSAYQLYLFIFYLKNHDYSILETAEWNALPGYSEHGAPEHQALDFINEEGINGENNPDEFAALPEFDWLVKNASRFHFVLSYPRNAEEGIAYEPWHWRFEKELPE